MHTGSFALHTFIRCSYHYKSVFGLIKDELEKKSKVSDCFVVKYNQINVKNVFFASVKRRILVVLLCILSLGAPITTKAFLPL